MPAQADQPPRLAVLTNPGSGRNRGGNPRFQAALSTAPEVMHRNATNPAEVRAALGDIQRFGPDVLAVNAGDGTVSSVLTALLADHALQPLPIIALLHGGTANITANDIGVRGAPARGLRRLLDWASQADREMRIRERSVLRVDAPGHAPICGMVFGAGAFIDGIEYCDEKVHGRGVGGGLGAAICGLRVLWAMIRRDRRLARPVRMRMEAGDDARAVLPEPIDEDFAVVIATTLENWALGTRPYWGEGEGPLHWTAIRYGARRLGRLLPAILFGRRHRHASPENGYYSASLPELSLHWDGHFMIDGQIYDFDHDQGAIRLSEAGRLSFLCL
jgi:hypothetical protein